MRLTCPVCNRDAYIASVDTFKPCPYCGIFFSGKHGANKRKDIRSTKDIPFVLSYDGQFFEASTINISESGICIKVYNRLSIPLSGILDLSIKGSHVKAQVMWTSDCPDISATVIGMKVLDGKLNLL